MVGQAWSRGLHAMVASFFKSNTHKCNTPFKYFGGPGTNGLEGIILPCPLYVESKLDVLFLEAVFGQHKRKKLYNFVLGQVGEKREAFTAQTSFIEIIAFLTLFKLPCQP